MFHKRKNDMGKDLWEPIVTIAAGVIGVAILAVLVSKNAQTGQVIGATGSAFSNILSAATGPVTGATAAPVNTQSSNSLTLPSLPSLSLNP
jgi:PRD1 phage membrane DNA delivery